MVNGYSQRVECELKLDEGEELKSVLRIRKVKLGITMSYGVFEFKSLMEKP